MENDSVSHSSASREPPELAHVLFLDIVSFSRLPTDKQADAIRELQDIVTSVPEIGQASRKHKLIKLPTGDGIALAFFDDPTRPAACARKIALALKANSWFQVRMGLHTGPVYRVSDINANKNLAGGGLNFAQRVMDVGDAGHILASKVFAEILLQFDDWKSALHVLTGVPVKHGLTAHLFNVFDFEFGNPEIPLKVRLEANGGSARLNPAPAGTRENPGAHSKQNERSLRGSINHALSQNKLAFVYARGVRNYLLPTATIVLISISLWFYVQHFGIGSDVPPQARQWYEKGISALREGTYLKATKALQMALDLDKGFVLAHASLADAWNELDFSAKAKDEILEASDLASSGRLSTTDQEYVAAVRHTIVRDFDRALGEYQAIFHSLMPDKRAAGYVDLGRAYEKSGKVDQAIASYEAAARLDGQDPAPFVRLGVLQSRRKLSGEADGNFTRAEHLYRAASNLEGIAEVAFQRGNDANTQRHLADARKYLQDSMQAADAIPSPQLKIRALTRLSVTEYLDGNTDVSIRLANQAIMSAEEGGLDYWAIDGLIRLGNAYISRRDYDKASAGLERALNLAERSRRPRLVALAQRSLATVREHQNRRKESISLAKNALDYYRTAGFVTESVEALATIVRALRDDNDNRAALASAADLLNLAMKVNQPAAIMLAEESMGSVLLNMERYPESRGHFELALAASRTLNSHTDYQLLHCANVAWRLGRYSDAAQILAALPTGSRENPGIKVVIDEIQLAILLSRRRYSNARELALKALADKANEDPGYFERLMGEIETASGSSLRAQEWCRKALSRARSDFDNVGIASASLALANAYLAGGSPAQAQPFAQTAHAAFVAGGQNESEYLSLFCLAKLSSANKDFAAAKVFAQRGLEIIALFEHSWTSQEYGVYLGRPDVRHVTVQLARLAHSGKAN